LVVREANLIDRIHPNECREKPIVRRSQAKMGRKVKW
jgi:hypothetical protein